MKNRLPFSSSLLRRCNFSILLLFIGLILYSSSCPVLYANENQPRYGDPGEPPYFSMQYPSDAFWHNGENGDPNRGRVFDITQPPYNAIPNDGRDDSKAFIRAYDDIMNRWRTPDNRISAFIMHKYTDISNIIYIPNGVYDLSQTIIYSGEIIRKQEGNMECLHAIRLIGQSREKTILRLMDNTFTADDPEQPVVSFAKSRNEINNTVATNFIKNVTINVGSGNPNAIGINFHGANISGINNVTIKSEDGQGHIGLDFVNGASQGYYHHITIEGFDTGVRFFPFFVAHGTFEHITLRNQNIVGFLMGKTSASIRNLFSQNHGPAIAFADSTGQLVVLDSRFIGQNSKRAIDQPFGHLFVRDLETLDYEKSINNLSTIFIPEYNSDSKIHLFDQSGEKSLNLPVEEIPELIEEDVSDWVSVNTFGAAGQASDLPTDLFGENQSSDAEKITHFVAYSQQHNDAPAIQAALNSGASVVYFKPGNYLINQTITVPSHVQKIELMFCKLKWGAGLNEKTPAFRIVGSRKDMPLIIEDLYNFHMYMGRYDFPYDQEKNNVVSPGGMHTWFEHASDRTLVLNNLMLIRCPVYKNSVAGGKVFISNVHGNRSVLHAEGAVPFHFDGQQVWCRHINPENEESGLIINKVSSLWIFGYKTEHRQDVTEFYNREHGQMEILGGFHNYVSRHGGRSKNSIFLNDCSNTSIITRMHAVWNVQISNLITDSCNDDVRKIVLPENANVPKGNRNGPMIPFYTSATSPKRK